MAQIKAKSVGMALLDLYWWYHMKYIQILETKIKNSCSMYEDK